MASVLNKFEEKTKILASKVNQNFEMLQSDIRTLDEEIDSRLSSTKENILIDIQAVGDSRADLNLSNITEVGIKKIVEYVLPNTSSETPITITSGFIAPTNGWVYLHGRGYSGGGYSAKINGFVVYSYNSDAGLDSASFTFPVLKGDKIEFGGSGIRRFWSNLKSFEEGEEE
jgi:hypothetical protein